MTKMLRIDDCSECTWRGVDGFVVMCQERSGADRVITRGGLGHAIPIPHWCELEDALDVAALEAQRDVLLATCIAARNWYALDGDGISEPVLGMLKVVIGEEALPSFFEDGAWWPAEARKPGVVYDSDATEGSEE